MSVLTWIGPAVAVGGLLFGLYQLRRYHHAVRVERTIGLHRDLTTGEVGAAQERFTTAMWWAGGEHCHQPVWKEIDDSPPTPGSLSTYDSEVAADPAARPLRDLYRVLYCFERINAAVESGAVDPALTWMLVSHHAVWWNTLTMRIPRQSSVDGLGTRHIDSLRTLAAWAVTLDEQSRSRLRRRRWCPSPTATRELLAWVQQDFERLGS